MELELKELFSRRSAEGIPGLLEKHDDYHYADRGSSGVGENGSGERMRRSRCEGRGATRLTSMLITPRSCACENRVSLFRR